MKTRHKVAGGVVVAVSLALMSVGLLLNELQTDAAPVPVPTPAEPVAPRASAEAAPPQEGYTALTLELQSLLGEPQPGVSFALGGVRGLSDAYGYAELMVPEGSQSFVWDAPWTSNYAAMDVRGETQRMTIKVRSHCPGRVQVLEDGVPFAGSIVSSGKATVLDDDGWAMLEARYCGWNHFAVWPHGSTGKRKKRRKEPLISFRSEVDGSEDLLLEVQPSREAWLWVLDASGEPLTAVGVSHAEREEPGLYHVSGYGQTVGVSITAKGGSPYVVDGYSVRVPLDGQEHVVRLATHRFVEVSVNCEEVCPDLMFCDGQQCEGEFPSFDCVCPYETATLSGGLRNVIADWQVERIVLGVAPTGETEVAVDMQVGEGTLEVNWTGRMPCWVGVWSGGARIAGDACDEQGRATFTGLPMGELVAAVSYDKGVEVGFSSVSIEEYASESVTLSPGSGVTTVQLLLEQELDLVSVSTRPGPLGGGRLSEGTFSVPTGVATHVLMKDTAGQRFSGMLAPGETTWSPKQGEQTMWRE